jgi:uncharacterized protein (DUF1330 family)
VKYYSVAELDVTDRGWARDYIANVTPMVERNGGRYLARTPNAERLEGDRPLPHVFLIIEWPSKEAATTFYQSEEYAPYLERRLAGSKAQFLLVPGEDANKVAKLS